MPDMPMPPIPMKWMGPSLSGNLMNFILIRYETMHQTSEPLSRIGDARQLRRSGAAREGGDIALRFQKRSHQPLRRKYALRDHNRGAGRRELFRISCLILINRAWERHKNGGAPDDRELGHGRGAGTGDDEMGLCDPHRQIGKERLDFGIDAKAFIGFAHPFLVLGARLLRDLELLPCS